MRQHRATITITATSTLGPDALTRAMWAVPMVHLLTHRKRRIRKKWGRRLGPQMVAVARSHLRLRVEHVQRSAEPSPPRGG